MRQTLKNMQSIAMRYNFILEKKGKKYIVHDNTTNVETECKTLKDVAVAIEEYKNGRKTFIVDRSKWKNARHGKGMPALRNSEGYQCCLGFCVQQTNPELYINGLFYPYNTKTEIEHFSCYNSNLDRFDNTPLSNDAAYINDNPHISNADRERKLIELFDHNGLNLKFEGEYNVATS
jgi:hypothetical protein